MLNVSNIVFKIKKIKNYLDICRLCELRDKDSSPIDRVEISISHAVIFNRLIIAYIDSIISAIVKDFSLLASHVHSIIVSIWVAGDD